MMTWGTQRDLFLKQLENHLYLSLAVNQRELQQKIYNNYAVINGQKFLHALEELKNILRKDSHELLLRMLVTATQCLQDPSAESVTALKSQYHYLQQRLNENRISNKLTVGVNLFFNSIYAISGFVASMTGFMLMNEAMAGLAGATASALVLSTGPWSLLALGVGIIILGATVTVIAATAATEEIKFLANKQTKEIDTFVNFLDHPNEAIIEEGSEVSQAPNLISQSY